MKSNIIFSGALSEKECDNLVEECENTLVMDEAVLGTEARKQDYTRKGKAAFIKAYNPEHSDLWKYTQNRLWGFINLANRITFGFDVNYIDEIQYTEYGVGDFYDWHVDTILETPTVYHRKLSLTLQLSDGNDYEGGDFEIHYVAGGDMPLDTLRKKGTIIVFPSFLSHRVTPITKGVRKSLVAWFEGKEFK